jgi:hypothetical protein
MKLKQFTFFERITVLPIAKALAICIAMVPIFLLVPLLVGNAINLPLMDQWNTPLAAIFKAFDGTLSFDDLIAQHNESRKFFPRLLFLGMAFATKWDTRYEVLMIFLIACLIAAQVYYLSRMTIQGSEYKRILLSLLANLLVFSPVQSDNWLWGIQLITFIPITCITAGLIVSCSSLEIKRKALILVVLCTISTYSYANGMLSWFVVFPSAIASLRFSQYRKLKAQRWLILGGMIGCISNLFLYFHNYIKPSQTPSFFESLSHPFEAVNFFLIFLGSPLGNHQLGTARIIGLILVILLSSILFYLLCHRKDRQVIYYSIPWIAIAMYSLASAAVTTAGRLGFGLEAAMPSRYTTFSLYLVVSLIYLIAITADHIIQSEFIRPVSSAHSIIKIFVFVLLALFLVLHTLTYRSSVEIMKVEHRDRLHAKACLLFVNVVDESSVIKKVVYPWPPLIVPMVNRLNEIHFLKPALIKSPDILESEKEAQYSLKASGFLDSDSIKQISKTEISISGWAIFPDRKQPADAVVLAYETSKSPPKAFAIAGVTGNSPDVAKALNNSAYQKVRWTKTFPVSKLPKGPVKLSAWAFDTETKQMYRLANSRSASAKLQISDNGLDTVDSK